MQAMPYPDIRAVERSLESLDSRDREVRAFVTEPDRVHRVSSEYDALEMLQRESRHSLPLAGVLVGVKDIIGVDGLETRAGSALPASLFAGPEATAVTRLRAAGALIAGKTVTTEFAFSEPGPTRNPRDLEHTPGGSSSGSAAAVAADLVRLALGTQTVDSIVTPAAYCGVVGFKPSFGRAPIDGVVPFSPSMDHVGLLANDVAMARMAASVLIDDWHVPIPQTTAVLGLPSDEYLANTEPGALAEFRSTVQGLAGSGLPTVQTEEPAHIDIVVSRHRALNAAEFARVHQKWFARYGDLYRPGTRAFLAEGESQGDEAITRGRQSGAELRGRLEDTMDGEGITAWISPGATGPAPHGLDYIGDPVMSVPWTHAHLPVVAMPTGSAGNGLPVGIQLVGRYLQDEALLAVALIVESALGRLARSATS